MEILLPDKVLRRPDEFLSRHLRIIRFMIQRGVRDGLFREREERWVEDIVACGHARAMINEGQLTCFMVVSPIPGLNGKPSRDIYSEALLWKQNDLHIQRQVQYTLLHEVSLIGDTMFGALYKDNHKVLTFLQPEHGYELIDLDEMPPGLQGELSPLLGQIVLIRNNLERMPVSPDEERRISEPSEQKVRLRIFFT